MSAPRGRCCSAALFYLSLPTETGSLIYKYPQNFIPIWIIVRLLLYCGASSLVLCEFSPLSYFDMTQDQFCPVSPLQLCTENPWRVFCSAIHGCRCNPSEPRCHRTVLAGMHFPPVMTSPFLFLFFIYFSLPLSAWDIRVDIRRRDFIHPRSNLTMWRRCGVKSQRCSRKHTTGSGNGFERRSTVVRMWGIFSLRIQEIVEEQQPRGGVLTPVAAEMGSSLSFSLAFSVFIIRARCGPCGPRRGGGGVGVVLPFVLTRWIIHVFQRPVLKNVA